MRHAVSTDISDTWLKDNAIKLGIRTAAGYHIDIIIRTVVSNSGAELNLNPCIEN